MFIGDLFGREKSSKVSVFMPNPFIDGMIAQNFRKNYFVSEFWAYQNLSGQIPTLLGSLRAPGQQRPVMVKQSGQRLLTEVLITCHVRQLSPHPEKCQL